MSDATRKGLGEGNKQADRHYREQAEEFASSGRARAKAEEAERALEGDEAEELAEAERKGRKPARD